MVELLVTIGMLRLVNYLIEMVEALGSNWYPHLAQRHRSHLQDRLLPTVSVILYFITSLGSGAQRRGKETGHLAMGHWAWLAVDVCVLLGGDEACVSMAP